MSKDGAVLWGSTISEKVAGLRLPVMKTISLQGEEDSWMRVAKEVTIKDVAQLAGVSPSTVSKVMNGSGRISEATKARVELAIRKINFRPNSIARSLRKSSTLSIGMINNARSSKNTFVLQLMVAVEAAAKREGFAVFMCNSGASQAREADYAEALFDKQVDGIIFLDNVVRERALPSAERDGTPLVFLNEYAAQSAHPSVIPDDRQGGHLAATHLLDLGHRRVAHISGRLKHDANHARLQGYRDALEEVGVPFDPTLVQGQDTWDESGGFESALRLLALSQPPTALFCASDTLAFGALDALRERSVKVPEDVAVVGFDDSLAAAQKRPPLSSVALPFDEMGQLAMKLLLAALREGKREATVHRLPCTLVRRASSGSSVKGG